ncbi:MAG: hypothetical protein Q8M18_15560, partial [Bradyrhizobium sp.]|nr:hypothetical protein [Bradyrhizobium sp.]
ATRRRASSKPKLSVVDRLLFVWLYRLFPSVLNAVANCPARDDHPVVSGGLRAVSALEVALAWRPAKGSAEDPASDPEMSPANRLWGAPRIHGELLKLGIEVAQSTIAKLSIPDTLSGLA